ncbi:hypothetical protein Mal64_27410 [Pseudobythopirellula maris]|uniref:Ice-binding protein C-terminal domain-containing protein n=1 Tax=Pseudobythopirellula maris TaxID=2527991 RepID=A0A5C5ZL92_9BACT|nr:PEP-CTERM sorting domain-containing protein [Pseudobythopirellula maris]TWT87203.1 hypothetical protein Mal64_27410 [Pseudobythopirellula maris]
MNATPIRQLLLVRLMAVCLAFGAVAPAGATSFAVLFRGSGSGEGRPDEQRINNPLHEQNATEGVNPLYEPSTVSFNPNQLPIDRSLSFEFNFQESVKGDHKPAPADAYVFEILLSDTDTGESITDLGRDFEICFEVPQWEQSPLPGSTLSDFSLSYYDEQAQAWVSEDDKIMVKENNTFCGTTDHFTVFAIGPAVPEPTSLLLALAASAACLVRRRR